MAWVKIPAHRLIFKPLRAQGHIGEVIYAKRTIYLDPRSRRGRSGGVSVAQVYLHELIHLAHPGWSETHVLKEERRRWKKLTWKDKAQLYKAMGRARLAGDD